MLFECCVYRGNLRCRWRVSAPHAAVRRRTSVMGQRRRPAACRLDTPTTGRAHQFILFYSLGLINHFYFIFFISSFFHIIFLYFDTKTQKHTGWVVSV